tara:strand:+ start:180 stop:1343 length:1164 start_codon:yes stop_codon:yes gene_type:complete
MALVLSQVVTPAVAARRASATPRRAVLCAKPKCGVPSPRVRTTRLNASEDANNENGVDEISDTSSSPDSSPLGDFISSPLFYVTGGIALGVAVVQKFENAALFLSAFPIVGLTVLSKTDFGKNLEDAVLAKRPALELVAQKRDLERFEVRKKLNNFFGPDRSLLARTPPNYLNGELPGDYGFDPLGLARDDDDGEVKMEELMASQTSQYNPVLSQKLDRAVELELLHARWAMLAVVGVVVPELLNGTGLLEIAEPVWWKVGAAKLSGANLDYLGLGSFVIAGKQGIAIIAACQLVLMGGPEYARFVGIRSLEPVGVYLPGDKNYPGGAPFDPFKLADDAQFFENQRVAEIKHGRLAMVAMAGCFAQAAVTQVGPVENVRSVLGGLDF